MISGHATPEGTTAYAKGRAAVHADHWRRREGLTLSSLGLGTYLGNPDEATDARYTAAVLKALESGLNVIDSASNYRFQRSERSIGAALRKAVEGGLVAREALLICTKGGFLAGDGGPPTDGWIDQTFVQTGVATLKDVVAGCHCMTPAYLKHQVDQSRRNLGVGTIDVFYIHNPETQVPELGPDEFYRRLAAAFAALEECVAAAKIRWYGAATWDAFRVKPGHPCALSLERMACAAADAGGSGHHFKVVQLPFNFAMMEAASQPTQPLEGRQATALEAADRLGLAVFTSVPLVQGQLLGRIPPDVHARFPGLSTDAQRCLQFVRSTPGILAPLCGMKDVRHVEENAKVVSVAPLGPREYASFLEA